MKTFLKFTFLIIQGIFLLALAFYLTSIIAFRIFFYVIAFVLCVKIFSDEMVFAYKCLYLILLILFPAIGIIFYFLTKKTYKIKRKNLSKTTLKKTAKNFGKTPAFIQSEFLYPTSRVDNLVYYGTGKEYFSALFESIEKAKEFIFLQFYIVKEGALQLKLFDLLKEKAKEGIKIYLVYDAFGSVTFDSKIKLFAKQYGFHAKPFNKISLWLTATINNRHHGKIAVIDGKIGFLGGVNLGDEYVNEQYRFGFWKDGGVSFCGEGINHLIDIFSENFGNSNLKKFKKAQENSANNSSFISLFNSTPSKGLSNISGIYLMAIYNAKKSIIASTPYLILDENIKTALITAVKRGVEVKIVIPEIPDKKLVYMVTLSYAKKLIEEGVKVYYYSEGFIHSKYTVIDGNYVICGSGNLDYRSMYLHYETGAFIKNKKLAGEIESDLIKKITKFDGDFGVINSALGKFLKIFAPMM